MDMSPRLLIISNRYPVGPDDVASPFVHDFRVALVEAGVSVEVVTPYYSSSSDNEGYLDESVHRFDWSDGGTVISQLPLTRPASYFKIWRYFRNGYRYASALLHEKGYDGVLALWAMPSGYLAYRLHRSFGIPYAVWALGSDINSWAQKPVVGKLVETILREADRCYADGYELAEKTAALCGKPCDFLPSMHRIDVSKTIDAPKEKHFICVGRVEQEKGVFDLLDAFEIFMKYHQDWKLSFVGTGRAEDELQAAVVRRELENNVTVYGYCERDTINRLLSRATAAVIPSHSDSLPLTFGEAMQAGLPVICSDIGDMPRLIDKYNVGMHFPVGEIDRLADCLDRIIIEGPALQGNCPRVLAELDISNAARRVRTWLDGRRETQEEMTDAFNR